MLDTFGKRLVTPLADKLIVLATRIGLSANDLTILGGIIGLSTVLFIYNDMQWTAVMLLLVSGLFDVLDGMMAKQTVRTEYGRVLDLVFDRLVETAVVVGLALRFPEHTTVLLFLLGLFIITKSLDMVETEEGVLRRERTKRKGPFKIGRTESFLLFALMILFPGQLWLFALALMALEVAGLVGRLRNEYDKRRSQ